MPKRILNRTINRSKNEKNDEHYTQLPDIENEVRHYRDQFKGMTVLCNCDDPRCSNFFKYFTRSFEILGLKRLIATCYKSQDVDLFTQKSCEKAVYHGPWVSDAKRWFSKRNCPAVNIARNYVVAEFEWQGCLERAIQWFVGKKDDRAIREYMAERKKDGDTDASELWSYFSNVITWIEAKFKHTSDRVKILKGLDWGYWYAKYGKAKLDTAQIERETQRLLKDKDVTKKRGIIPYLLDGDERHLSIRAFDEGERLAAYTRQGGKCPKCGKEFAIEEMQADHITPWAKGGKSVAENCQMLCADCNRRKSAI